jgi:CIC family chloride channel protein
MSNPFVPGLGMWFVVLAPVIGGLLYGPLIDRFAKEARGHGVPEVMLAVAEKGGRIRPRVAAIKSLASAICIGSGGSVGREGPIVQIGSALGSSVGQAVRLPESRLRVLVACGAAGGISATFNAPIAGVFFGLELILQDFATESFGVVVLASVVADVIGRAAFGGAAFLQLPAFELHSYLEYPLYAGLGVLAGAVGMAFVRVLYGTEDVLDRLWRGPQWLRPAVGGILLGLVLLGLPQMYGVGYPVLERAIHGDYLLWFLLLLLVGKVVATSLTIAIGGSGGVFAPSLLMGALLGTAYGLVMQYLMPGVAGPAGAYGLVGMGAVFAGAARAPITAVLIIFELTGEYRLILPLMFAVVVAAGISRLLSEDTIYTLKLRRRGIEIMEGRQASLMQLLTVGEAMGLTPAPLSAQTPLHQIIDRFSAERRDALPVVDAEGIFRGTVTSHQVEEAARDNVLDATAGELAVEEPGLRPRQSLTEALRLLVRDESSGLPVLSEDGRSVIGWLTHRDVLRAYSERLERTVGRGDGRDSGGWTNLPSGQRGASPRPPSQGLEGHRVIEVQLTHDRSPVGQPLREVPFPPTSMVLALRRDGRTKDVSGDVELRRGDRLTILVRADQVEQLVGLLTASATGRTG